MIPIDPVLPSRKRFGRACRPPASLPFALRPLSYWAVPPNVTGAGVGTAEVVLIVNVPFFAPIVPPAAVEGGANTTPIVQFAPALSVKVPPVPQLPAFAPVARRKYVALAPPNAIEVPVMFGFPAGLLSVMKIVALTTPWVVIGNAMLPGDVIARAAKPVPVNLTPWLPMASVKVSVAVLEPTALGVKVTPTVQVPPAATVAFAHVLFTRA